MVALDEVGLHCDTGFHSKPPRSVLTNVTLPFRVKELIPMRSILPPVPKVTDPPKEKKVIVSPGPSPLWIVVIGVVEGFSPTVCTPCVLIVAAGDICVESPEVGGTLVPPL